MRFILHYVVKYKMLIVLNLIGVFAFVGIELGIPTVISKMIDIGITNHDIDYLYHMGFVILCIALLGGIGNVFITYCSSRISTYITRDIRNDIFKKAQAFSHIEYNTFGVSSMITRVTNDAFVIMQFVNMVLRIGFITPIMIISSMMMILFTNIPLSLVIGTCIPIIFLGICFLVKKSDPLSMKQQKGLDKINRILRENLSGIRVIRAFRKDIYETNRFQEANTDFTKYSKKLFKMMSLTHPLFFLLLNFAMLVIFWMSSYMIDQKALQIGQLVAFVEYMFHAMYSMMLFSTVFVMYPKAANSTKRIQELLASEISIVNPEHGVMQGEEESSIQFKNVSFSYPDGEVPVLKDISFEAKKGQTVAFIGSTGSGKSTLINLIPRLYDVTSGSIYIDGVDIRQYDIQALRHKIGFIPQKALLFSGSIQENIQYGKKDAKQEELEHATKTAYAYDFIMDKPQAFQSLLAEGGTNVSGGQKQRLSIARALVRKPEIYIFDDSFSALDFKTDAMIRSKLKEETKDSICLIVAQRISSIQEADMIIVLHEGEMVGKGTHEELLSSCDIYMEIASSQLTKEELQNEV